MVKRTQRGPDLEAEAEKADRFIMELCEPKHMTPSEAAEFLDLVIVRCRSALEALHEENPDLRD